MYRLVSSKNEEERDELDIFLCEKASKLVFNALDVWAGSPEALYERYLEDFAGQSGKEADSCFFKGISLYISSETVRPEFAEWADSPNRFPKERRADHAVGLELIFRKISRMKEKAADPKNYYTFDIFEEYLLARMAADYDPAFYLSSKDPYVITTQEEIDADEEKLRTQFKVRGGEKEYCGDFSDEDIEEYLSDGAVMDNAEWLACSINRVDYMSVAMSELQEHENLYFWDADYEIVFEKTFVEGIRGLISGRAEVLGYSYEYVAEIFTDIGVKAPLLLIGSKAAFEEVKKLTRERLDRHMDEFMKKVMSSSYDDLMDSFK